ncbi:MAG: hypothetical protein Q9181_008247 [Wetmoreana brouardii]
MLEEVETDDKGRPKQEIGIKEVHVLVDPFDLFLKDEAEKEQLERANEEIRKKGGAEDERGSGWGKGGGARGK